MPSRSDADGEQFLLVREDERIAFAQEFVEIEAATRSQPLRRERLFGAVAANRDRSSTTCISVSFSFCATSICLCRVTRLDSLPDSRPM
jgi:hypothetical protein